MNFCRGVIAYRWSRMNPTEGDYRERLVCQLHLIETSEETAERLNRYLGLVALKPVRQLQTTIRMSTSRE